MDKIEDEKKDKPIRVELDKPIQLEVTYGNVRNTMWNTLQATLMQVAIYGTVLGMLFLPSYIGNININGTKGKVAKMYVNGTIGRDSGYGNTDANRMIEYLDSAKNSNASGYWFVINSPGGYVYPSKEIADKVLEVKAGKDGILGNEDDVPVVMQIKDMGASGAYWIACTGDKIYADETSLVGSIGVKMGYLEISELLKKIGVKPVNIHAGKYKDMGNPYNEITDEQKKLLEDHINVAYKMFVSHVAKNRNMKYEEVEKLATGWIYYGDEAKKNKLIDEMLADELIKYW